MGKQTVLFCWALWACSCTPGSAGGPGTTAADGAPAASPSDAPAPSNAEPGKGGDEPAAMPAAPTAACPNGWYRPARGTTWVWDLDGSVVPSPTVTAGPITFSPTAYDVDLFNTSAAQVAAYHRAGKKVICYLDAGSWESGRSDGRDIDPACYCGPGVSTTPEGACSGAAAAAHKLVGWPEWWFDLHTPACITAVRTLLSQRIALAQAKGCDAIEPDNLDSWQNNSGWGTTLADQNAFVAWLGQTAHDHCLGAMLKNAGGLLVDGNGRPTPYGPSLTALFDGVVNEQCVQYDECQAYAGFLAANKAVFNAEYGSTASPSKCGSGGIMTLQYKDTSVAYGNINQVCWPH